MADEIEHPAILAGDRDRDASIELLSGAVADGRLTLEEFSDRVGLAQTARTRDDLVRLTRDLPVVRADTPAAVAPARYRALFSKLVRRGPWELEQHSSVRCVCGTVVLDLTQVRLAGSETQLDIYNLFGTVTVIVPEEVQVGVIGGGAFASEVIETPTRPSPARRGCGSRPAERVGLCMSALRRSARRRPARPVCWGPRMTPTRRRRARRQASDTRARARDRTPGTLPTHRGSPVKLDQGSDWSVTRPGSRLEG